MATTTQRYICYYSPNFGTRIEPVMIDNDSQELNFTSDYPFAFISIGNSAQMFQVSKPEIYSFAQSMVQIYDLNPSEAVHFLSTCQPKDLIQAGTYTFVLS